MVKLAFYRGPYNLYSTAIKVWTLGPYSHCELIIDDTMFSAVEGVGSRYLVYPPLNAPRWDYMDVPMSGLDKARVWKHCMAEMGCPYDWKGLFLSQVVGLRREDPDKWFCSEFCTSALQYAGLLRGIKPCTVSPNRLARLMRKSKFKFV